jgi:hypothetical protein
LAQITLGLATSRSPMLSMPSSLWSHIGARDTKSTRLLNREGESITYDQLLASADPKIAELATQPVWDRAYEATQSALETLKKRLVEAQPDIVLFIGDDEDEIIHADNRPALMVFTGSECPIVPRAVADPNDLVSRESNWQWGSAPGTYPVAADLSVQLLKSLINEDFDVAHSTGFNSEKGMSHGFGFLYERLMPRPVVPIVPIILNVHWPPNQPTPRRFYKIGQAARRAVEQWPANLRVAVIATGGLSVGRLDEELDRRLLEALKTHDVDALAELPAGWRQRSTGEVHAWMTAAGAAEHLNMDIVEYVPGYRSPGGTGCGLAFATWS